MHETLLQKDQDQAIRFCKCWSFDLPTQDDELLPEEGVFCHELGLASGKVSHRTQHERGIGRFGPVDEAVVERLKTHVCQALDEGDNRLHRLPLRDAHLDIELEETSLEEESDDHETN